MQNYTHFRSADGMHFQSVVFLVLAVACSGYEIIRTFVRSNEDHTIMNRYVLSALAALIILPHTAGASRDGIYRKGWIDFNKNGRMDVYEDPAAPLEDRVRDLLSQMTVEEKTCQMATLYGSGRILKDPLPQESWKSEIWKDGIGNIDEEHNGLGSFRSEYSFPYTKHVEADRKSVV